jgi:PAS domain S-box-containing protein
MSGVHDGNGNSRESLEDLAIHRAILNTAVDAIITIDDHGIVRHANAAAARMFGYTQEELVGNNVSLLMPSPHREFHDGYLTNYLRTREAKIIGIGRAVVALKKDGTLFPVDVSVSEVPLEGTMLFTGIVRDMTDRRRIEDELRRERTFTDDLIETANAIVLILDESGRILRFNHYMEHLSGYSLEEVRGRDWFELFVRPSDQEWLRNLFQSVVYGQAVEGNVNSIITRSGEERVVTWSAKHLLDSENVVYGVLAIGNDITELMETERLLIQNERLAAIGQMVTGLAHESRNALQRSRACLDVLELDAADHPDQLELLRRTQHALDELQRLYEEVRSYAAPMKLDCMDCDMGELLQETWNDLHSERLGRGVEIRIECQAETPCCHCDPARIKQVIRNILENAVYVAPSKSEIVCTCDVVEHRGASCLRLSIHDHGPGLNSEQLQNIFEPFYTTKTKGTGLGMAISRRIIEAHGGEIRVGVATPGTEIVVTLPIE